MNQHYTNDLMKSFYCFVDNLVCGVAGGAAYGTYGLQPTTDSSFPGLINFVADAPIRQFVNDTSIAAAPVFTSYINGLSVVGFNASNATAYCSLAQPTNPNLYLNGVGVAGHVKTFASYLNNKALSRVLEDNDGYPCIYVQNAASENMPFALGRIFNSVISVRLLVFTDRTHEFDSVYSFLSDQKLKEIPYTQYQGHGGASPAAAYNPAISVNNYGNFTYDYFSMKRTAEAIGAPRMLLWSVRTAGLKMSLGKFKNTNRDFFMGYIDCEIQAIRTVGEYGPNL